MTSSTRSRQRNGSNKDLSFQWVFSLFLYIYYSIIFTYRLGLCEQSAPGTMTAPGTTNIYHHSNPSHDDPPIGSFSFLSTTTTAASITTSIVPQHNGDASHDHGHPIIAVFLDSHFYYLLALNLNNNDVWWWWQPPHPKGRLFIYFSSRLPSLTGDCFFCHCWHNSFVLVTTNTRKFFFDSKIQRNE